MLEYHRWICLLAKLTFLKSIFCIFHLSLFKSTGDIVLLFFLRYVLIVHPLKCGLCPTKFAYYQRIISLVVFQLFVVSIISWNHIPLWNRWMRKLSNYHKSIDCTDSYSSSYFYITVTSLKTEKNFGPRLSTQQFQERCFVLIAAFNNISGFSFITPSDLLWLAHSCHPFIFFFIIHDHTANLSRYYNHYTKMNKDRLMIAEIIHQFSIDKLCFDIFKTIF